MLTYPVLPTVLYVGSVWVLHLTPLYARSLEQPLLHEALHVHMLLTGCLFAWPLVGLDPVANRGSFRVRGALLVLAAAAHGALAKLIAAGAMGGGLGASMPAADRQLGAQLMYYGSDLVDVGLLVAFFSAWYAARGRAWAREQRCGAVHDGEPVAAPAPGPTPSPRAPTRAPARGGEVRAARR